MHASPERHDADFHCAYIIKQNLPAIRFSTHDSDSALRNNWYGMNGCLFMQDCFIFTKAFDNTPRIKKFPQAGD